MEQKAVLPDSSWAGATMMLMTKERPPAIRTLGGWAISVLGIAQKYAVTLARKTPQFRVNVLRFALPFKDESRTAVPSMK